MEGATRGDMEFAKAQVNNVFSKQSDLERNISSLETLTQSYISKFKTDANFYIEGINKMKSKMDVFENSMKIHLQDLNKQYISAMNKKIVEQNKVNDTVGNYMQEIAGEMNGMSEQMKVEFEAAKKRYD